MTAGSLFSGIGGFDLGLERAGMAVSWQVEIEPFCRAVLERHFPNARRHEDIRKCGAGSLAGVDLICAGVPCQDVSVAGRRAGLAGERTGLFYEFARILRELRPRWFVFENVPGLFSSNRGRDFAEVIRVLMVECGYGVSWRVLDSRFFGVAQRRRRVFIVGYFGAPCPPEILFEPEGRGGDTSARRASRQDIARSLTASIGGACGPGGGREAFAFFLRASDGYGDGCDNLVAPTVIQDVRGGTRDRTGSGQGIGISQGGPSYTLGAVERHGVAYPGGAGHGGAAANSDGVRDFAGLPAGLDSARYRALGNAVTVQVAEWLARAILLSEGR